MARSLNKTELERYDALLRERHAELGRMLEDQERGLEDEGTRETQADEYVEARAHGTELQVHEQNEARIREIAEARKRIEEGTYGLCEACGEPIAEARLAEVPETRRCVECQDRAEAQAASPPGAEEGVQP